MVSEQVGGQGLAASRAAVQCMHHAIVCVAPSEVFA